MLQIGIITISDRASQGVYQDLSGRSIESWLKEVLTSPWQKNYHLIPDNYQEIVDILKLLAIKTNQEVANTKKAHLILTTGGTGPQLRDVTPEATLAVADKVMDGFAEEMRRASLKFVPTAILSRQVAVISGKSLIINLPGKPKAIKECLDAIFSAVPYCLDLLGAPKLETNPDIIKAFRPKK